MQAQGPKDLLGAVYIQRLPRDPVHDLAQGDKIDVAVMEPGARRPDGPVGGNDRQRPFITRPAVVGIHVGPQTGGVGQELPDGDAALAVGGEFRPIPGHRVIEAQAAGIGQLHDGRGGGHHLG